MVFNISSRMSNLGRRIQYSFARRIDSGRHGVVYKLNNQVAAKTYFSRGFSKKELGDIALGEFGRGQYLYEHGVAVPQMYDIVPPSVSVLRPLPMTYFNWTVFMEYVPWDSIRKGNFSSLQLKRAEELKHIELSKARDPGFETTDATDKNVLFSPEEDAVKLVDFVNWFKPRYEGDE